MIYLRSQFGLILAKPLSESKSAANFIGVTWHEFENSVRKINLTPYFSYYYMIFLIFAICCLLKIEPNICHLEEINKSLLLCCSLWSTRLIPNFIYLSTEYVNYWISFSLNCTTLTTTGNILLIKGYLKQALSYKSVSSFSAKALFFCCL